MKIKLISITLFLLLFFSGLLFCKEVIFQGESTVKQTRYQIRSGSIVLTEKFQDLNGKITQSWFINDGAISKDEYFEKLKLAEKEELELEREELERKKAEEEQQKRELEERKIKENEDFYKKTRLEAQRKLVSLELGKIEKSFSRLDKYELEEYFVFGDQTFYSSEDLEDVRFGLLNKAKRLTISSVDELDSEDLKRLLEKLEVIPNKIEMFFRHSVKHAINKCDDTKRLKDLLALI